MAFGDRGIRNAAAGRRSLPATHVTPRPGLPARPAGPPVTTYRVIDLGGNNLPLT